jgi:flagella basal body P-ring formation protein FlgA
VDIRNSALAAPVDAGSAPIAQALALTRQNLQVPDGARVEVVPGSLDPRLRLAPCARIEPHLPAGTRLWGHARVGLRCVSGPVRWNVYLPLTVHVWAPAIVSAGPLAAGATLGAGDLRLAEVDLAASPARAYTSPDDLIGRTLAVALPAGVALRADALRQRQWFQAGETVTVVARGTGYAVTGEAQALSNGVEGQSARLRTDSGRVITAVPVGPRRVELPL